MTELDMNPATLPPNDATAAVMTMASAFSSCVFAVKIADVIRIVSPGNGRPRFSSAMTVKIAA